MNNVFENDFSDLINCCSEKSYTSFSKKTEGNCFDFVSGSEKLSNYSIFSCNESKRDIVAFHSRIYQLYDFVKYVAVSNSLIFKVLSSTGGSIVPTSSEHCNWALGEIPCAQDYDDFERCVSRRIPGQIPCVLVKDIGLIAWGTEKSIIDAIINSMIESAKQTYLIGLATGQRITYLPFEQQKTVFCRNPSNTHDIYNYHYEKLLNIVKE